MMANNGLHQMMMSSSRDLAANPPERFILNLSPSQAGRLFMNLCNKRWSDLYFGGSEL